MAPNRVKVARSFMFFHVETRHEQIALDMFAPDWSVLAVGLVRGELVVGTFIRTLSKGASDLLKLLFGDFMKQGRKETKEEGGAWFE